MKPQVAELLETLRRDFANVSGSPFQHFFCPVLFVDEETELCQAHVVNSAFPETSPNWTIQRKDVDNFYGSVFESDFVNLKFNEPGIAAKALVDPDLYRRLRPKIFLDGTDIEHSVPKGPVPKKFPEFRLDYKKGTLRLGLKMEANPSTFNEHSDWQFQVFQDVRVPAIVSVLKAAHLTMFALMGYTYALGQGGLWLGQLLGTFYLRNAGSSKADIIKNAEHHFGPVAAMVRPVVSAPINFTGTVDDKRFHFCWSDDTEDHVPWGLMVYVRTGILLHTALLPAFEHEAGVNRFLRFLRSQGDSFEVSMARYRETHWTIATERRRVKWPVANLT